MRKNIDPQYRAILAIQDKYGLVLFRCGLTHLVSCGAQALQDADEVAKCKKNIQDTTPGDAIMSPDFQCSIVDCAVELSNVDIWDLFRYIQTDVVIDDWKD